MRHAPFELFDVLADLDDGVSADLPKLHLNDQEILMPILKDEVRSPVSQGDLPTPQGEVFAQGCRC